MRKARQMEPDASPGRLLVVTLTEDGEHYRIHASNGKECEDVTAQFEVQNMVVTFEDGRTLAGFFVGQPTQPAQEG